MRFADQRNDGGIEAALIDRQLGQIDHEHRLAERARGRADDRLAAHAGRTDQLDHLIGASERAFDLIDQDRLGEQHLGGVHRLGGECRHRAEDRRRGQVGTFDVIEDAIREPHALVDERRIDRPAGRRDLDEPARHQRRIGREPQPDFARGEGRAIGDQRHHERDVRLHRLRVRRGVRIERRSALDRGERAEDLRIGLRELEAIAQRLDREDHAEPAREAHARGHLREHRANLIIEPREGRICRDDARAIRFG